MLLAVPHRVKEELTPVIGSVPFKVIPCLIVENPLIGFVPAKVKSASGLEIAVTTLTLFELTI